jgi:hypothetical protein
MGSLPGTANPLSSQEQDDGQIAGRRVRGNISHFKGQTNDKSARLAT